MMVVIMCYNVLNPGFTSDFFINSLKYRLISPFYWQILVFFIILGPNISNLPWSL